MLGDVPPLKREWPREKHPGRLAAYLFLLAGGSLLPSTGCFRPDAEDLALLDVEASETERNGIERGPQATGVADADAAPGAGKPVLFGFACVSPVKSDYHPPGYADSDVHGAALKAQTEDCRSCHGKDLEGCDFAGGCNNCHDGGHPQGWRSDCTYCHGGENNLTGAPPSDLVRNKPLTDLSFFAHDAHVAGTLHAPYDCAQCHTKPSSILTNNHVFDATPGKAEVTFAAGLSAAGKYDGKGSCSNLYCHGNGVEPGAARDDEKLTDCNSCHAFDDAKQLSGRHDAHVNGGLLGFLFDKVACNECHSDVIDKDGKIVNPALHVNGKVDLALEQHDITYDGTRCNGICHNAPHTVISTWQP